MSMTLTARMSFGVNSSSDSIGVVSNQKGKFLPEKDQMDENTKERQ